MMYQTMYSPHILVQLPSSVQQPTHPLYHSVQSNHCVNNSSALSPNEMASMRSPRSMMPPPPHLYLNNNTSHKNYNGNGKHNVKAGNHWNSKKSMGPDSEDSGRSSTPHSGDSDDSCHSPLPEIKGVKRLHDVYGTQHTYFQHHSRNYYSHADGPNHTLNYNGSYMNHSDSYQTKRRLQNSMIRGGGGRSSIRRRDGSWAAIAPERFLARAHQVEVRGEPSCLRTGGVWDNLSITVWQRFVTKQQTEETYRKKMILWRNLYIIIKSNFPRYGLFLVGSTISGFGSDTSDVDMCLLVRNTEMDQRCEAVVHLDFVRSLLKKCDYIKNAELIQAKVPILKFRDSERGLEVDLNCNNAVGIRNTHLLRCYAGADWRVKPLVLIVKLWARHHHINDAKNMTISSYSLALMVIHFLQCGVMPPVVPCLHGLYQNKFCSDSDIHAIDMHEVLLPFKSDNTQSLGELFLRFLQYYAYFDYASNAISVRLGARVPIEECRRARSPKNEPHQWKLLCIEEPFDLTNTARSVYDADVFEHVKAVFTWSYCVLNETFDLNSVFGSGPQKLAGPPRSIPTIVTMDRDTASSNKQTNLETVTSSVVVDVQINSRQSDVSLTSNETVQKQSRNNLVTDSTESTCVETDDDEEKSSPNQIASDLQSKQSNVVEQVQSVTH